MMEVANLDLENLCKRFATAAAQRMCNLKDSPMPGETMASERGKGGYRWEIIAL